MSFIVFDCDFDLPQHRLAALADGSAQGTNRLWGIEVEYRHEIQMFKVFIGIQATPGQDGIGCADNRRFVESVPDVFFIIILKERSVNDTEDVMLMVKPVIIHLPVGYFLD